MCSLGETWFRRSCKRNPRHIYFRRSHIAHKHRQHRGIQHRYLARYRNFDSIIHNMYILRYMAEIV
jgi:hypothetical protein